MYTKHWQTLIFVTAISTMLFLSRFRLFLPPFSSISTEPRKWRWNTDPFPPNTLLVSLLFEVSPMLPYFIRNEYKKVYTVLYMINERKSLKIWQVYTKMLLLTLQLCFATFFVDVEIFREFERRMSCSHLK